MAIPSKKKRRLYDRDNNRCLRCGSSCKLQADHILPKKSLGGTNRWENLQTLCKLCNQWKHTRYIDYRTDKRRRKVAKNGEGRREQATELENLAAATGALDKALLRRYETLLEAIATDPSQLALTAADTGALRRALQQWDEALLEAITAHPSQLTEEAWAGLVAPARRDDPPVDNEQT